MTRAVLALLLAGSACLAHAQPSLIVGAVVTQSGMLADLAVDLRKSILLWQEEANAAGGLIGRRVELRLLDDRSEAHAARELYERLIVEERAEVLIGPFSTAAARGAAEAAERHRRVLVDVTGGSRGRQRVPARYVFQVAAPLRMHGASLAAIAGAMAAGRVLVLARSDPVSQEMAAGATAQAEALGLPTGPIESYGGGSEKFVNLVAKAKRDQVRSWVAFGSAREAAAMVVAFRQAGYWPAVFAAHGTSEPEFIRRVGQDAEFSLDVLSWDRAAKTARNAEFVKAYERKWSAEPSVLAAQGYAACKVLDEAVRRAGSVEADVLREALLSLRTETLLGNYEVDAQGAQRGARPLILQIQNGRREIVWPEGVATAKWRLPDPPREPRPPTMKQRG